MPISDPVSSTRKVWALLSHGARFKWLEDEGLIWELSYAHSDKEWHDLPADIQNRLIISRG